MDARLVIPAPAEIHPLLTKATGSRFRGATHLLSPYFAQPANFGSGKPGTPTRIAKIPPECGSRSSSSGARFCRADVTNSVLRSGPPKAHIVGHIAGTANSASVSPRGERRTTFPPR